MFFIFLLSIIGSCSSPKTSINKGTVSSPLIVCNEQGCKGTYIGPEFKDGSDIGHQFSNKMCTEVGNKLKALYEVEKYTKVDLKNIDMHTIGMGSGTVQFTLKIPFVNVPNKCDADTSFDHSSGWNHKPELARRVKELETILLPGEKLSISELKVTPEGLQEYWIQWKNKEVQSACAP